MFWWDLRTSVSKRLSLLYRKNRKVPHCTDSSHPIPLLLKQPPRVKYKQLNIRRLNWVWVTTSHWKKKKFWPFRWIWQGVLSRLCILVEVKKGTYKCEPFTKALQQSFPGKQCANQLKSFRNLTKSSRRHLPKLPKKLIWTVGALDKCDPQSDSQALLSATCGSTSSPSTLVRDYQTLAAWRMSLQFEF